ncbi:MAG TPA: hypothetical protein VHY32_07945 [Caulobacteraceae bacterium]|jgi:hypothetical protein|nr:hypothetical protein [Caulobacteraceae bacterium]
MFEFGRELKRLFQPDAPKDGLTGGDASLLELLELDMLCAEARAADIAAGRISATDPAERQLEAALVWREIARRTGDALALRKSAAAAESSANSFGRVSRPQGWARARCEQGRAAMLGAALFGDRGLDAAAEVALREARASFANAAGAAQVDAAQAVIEARKVLGAGDRAAVIAAARRFDAPIAALLTRGRRRAIDRLWAASASADRADLLAAAGARLKDPMLLRMALDGLASALERLDPAYEPLTWAILACLRATTRSALAELDADLSEAAGAVNDLVDVLDRVGKDHSPLDWARAQQALADALQIMGEVADCDRAFEQASACYKRAMTVFAGQPGLVEGPAALHNSIQCLLRAAELRGDLAALDEAEAALRTDLAASNPAKDPVAWGVRQLSFARAYESRANIAGRDTRREAGAAQALTAALEVFGEHGRRDLADLAASGLARLRVREGRRRRV